MRLNVLIICAGLIISSLSRCFPHKVINEDYVIAGVPKDDYTLIIDSLSSKEAAFNHLFPKKIQKEYNPVLNVGYVFRLDLIVNKHYYLHTKLNKASSITFLNVVSKDNLYYGYMIVDLVAYRYTMEVVDESLQLDKFESIKEEVPLFQEKYQDLDKAILIQLNKKNNQWKVRLSTGGVENKVFI